MCRENGVACVLFPRPTKGGEPAQLSVFSDSQTFNRLIQKSMMRK